MKTMMAVLTVFSVVAVALLFGGMAYAATTQTIYLRIEVLGHLDIDLKDEWVNANLDDPKAEAFSELKDEGVSVDKLAKDDSTLWLFTKTE